MAEIVAGLGCSHAPSIAHVYDGRRTREPEWRPLFDAFDRAEKWLMSRGADVLVCIYNDHIDQYSLDAWPQFAIGVGSPDGGGCASCGATGWGGVGVDSVLAAGGCCGAGGAAGLLVPGC